MSDHVPNPLYPHVDVTRLESELEAANGAYSVRTRDFDKLLAAVEKITGMVGMRLDEQIKALQDNVQEWRDLAAHRLSYAVKSDQPPCVSRNGCGTPTLCAHAGYCRTEPEREAIVPTEKDGSYAIALHSDGTHTDMNAPYCRECGSNDIQQRDACEERPSVADLMRKAQPAPPPDVRLAALEEAARMCDHLQDAGLPNGSIVAQAMFGALQTAAICIRKLKNIEPSTEKR